MHFIAPHASSLLEMLVHLFPQSSKNTLREWLKNGRVQVNEEIIKNGSVAISSGTQINLVERKKIIGENIAILYEDQDLVVVNKPSGLLSVAAAFDKSNTVHAVLKAHYKPRKIFVVHRLDQDTSGVMVFAFNQTSFDNLKTLFEKHNIERAYTAVVEGEMHTLDGTWESYQYEDRQYVVHETKDTNLGTLAITHYRTMSSTKRYSWMEFRLETGRKNQIRVHCQTAGHSVVGDKKYGAYSNPLKRLCLHAHLLAFQHPITKKTMRFTVPVPEEFYKLMPGARE